MTTVVKKIDTLPAMELTVANNDKLVMLDVSESAVDMTKLMTMSQIPISTAAQLAAGIVENAKIKDGAVTLSKMAANSIDSNQYVDGSIDRVHLAADIVDGTKIADNAINSEHIAAGAIDLAHMSSNSVDSDQYVDGSIDTVHLANEAVTEAKLGAIKRTVAIPVFGFEDGVIVKNFTNLFSFPPMLNGHVITSVSATLLGAVSVSGALTIKLINGLNEMASVTINQNAWSGTATPNTSYDDVASFGKFSVNVTGAGSGAKGLTVYLEVTG